MQYLLPQEILPKIKNYLHRNGKPDFYPVLQGIEATVQTTSDPMATKPLSILQLTAFITAWSIITITTATTRTS
jgi:hypothetical protein